MSLFSPNRDHSFAEGFFIGFIATLIAQAIFRLLWAMRYLIVIFVAGWFLQYYVSGDAKRDQIVEKNFDETAATMVRFHYEYRTNDIGLGHRELVAAAPVVANNTPATLTKFFVHCSFYRLNQFDRDSARNFDIKYPFKPLRPGETREVPLDLDLGDEVLLADIDPETLRCHISGRRFDKHEMYQAALAASKNSKR